MAASTETSKRPRLASVLLWGLPLLALLDAARAASGGWRPVGTIEAALLALWVLWGGAALALLHPAVRARLGVLWRELLLVVTISVLGWLALERIAHQVEAARHATPPFHTRGVNLHRTVYPDPEFITGIEGASRFTTGPDGLRASGPPATSQSLQVIAIGGSTTECVYLDDTETWAARLPAYLSMPELAATVWVGNAGISGFDLRDHVQFVKESSALDQASALVAQPGINDCWRFLAHEVDAMDYGRFEPPPAVTPSPAPAPHRPFWARSRVIQLYHTLRQAQPPLEQQEGIGGPEYQIRREKRATAEKTDTLPPLEDGLSRYRERIDQLIEVCEQRSVPLLFTTQPVVWRADLSAEGEARCWFGWLPDGRYLTLAALRDAIDQYNETLMQVCATRGVPCVDLSPLNGSEAYFYDDCHFTEAGAEAVARLVGPALAALLR